MSRRRNLWGGLAAVGIAAAFVVGVHYAPGLSTAGGRYAEAVQSEYPEFRLPTGSSTVSTSSSAADSLRRAGLVDGTTINTQAVRKLLSEIPATTPAPTTAYDRDSFGPAWADTDRNGCDQRNDVLARDLTAVSFKPGTHDCVVMTGTLHDPYTGKEISFTRGATTSTAVQIDHMVPIHWATEHGASTWTPQRREQFATDLSNLTAVDGPTNAAKSDQGPGSWLPPASSYDCIYVARFTYVVHRYDLTLDTADRQGIARVLATCN